VRLKVLYNIVAYDYNIIHLIITRLSISY
jgi:hypothetical protein